jgi:hypothetical protein
MFGSFVPRAASSYQSTADRKPAYAFARPGGGSPKVENDGPVCNGHLPEFAGDQVDQVVDAPRIRAVASWKLAGRRGHWVLMRSTWSRWV